MIFWISMAALIFTIGLSIIIGLAWGSSDTVRASEAVVLTVVSCFIFAVWIGIFSEVYKLENTEVTLVSAAFARDTADDYYLRKNADEVEDINSAIHEAAEDGKYCITVDSMSDVMVDMLIGRGFKLGEVDDTGRWLISW